MYTTVYDCRCSRSVIAIATSATATTFAASASPLEASFAPLAMLGLLLELLELVGLERSRPPEGCCLVCGLSLADRGGRCPPWWRSLFPGSASAVLTDHWSLAYRFRGCKSACLRS